MTKLPQPIISSVHGMAVAAGCQLVANSDIAIASTDAHFSVSGINLGLFCSTPAVALSRNISRKQAFEMLMTGRFIDAQTALGFGLVNQVVTPTELNRAVKTLAATIAKKPARAVKIGETMACNMMFDETIEGINAFIDTREPNWLEK